MKSIDKKVVGKNGDESKGSMSAFGKAFEEVRAAVEAEIAMEELALAAKSAETSAPAKPATPPTAQERLMAAIEACDVVAAKSACQGGANPKGDFPGAVGLFEAWARAARAGASEAAAWETLAWLDGEGVLLRVGFTPKECSELAWERDAMRAGPGGGARLAAYRRGDVANWLRMLPLGDGRSEANSLLRLGEKWERDEDPSARVTWSEWLDRIFGDVDCSDVECIPALSKLGARMGRAHWERLSEMAVTGPSVAAVVEAQGACGEMGADVAAKLLAHALEQDCLAELSAVAHVCPRPMWRLPMGMWGEMGCSAAELASRAKGGGLGPTLVEYAFWQMGRRDEAALDLIQREPLLEAMACLRALARIPAATKELGAPDPCIHGGASARTMERAANLVPQLLLADAEGRTFAHHWAADPHLTFENGRQERIVDLLSGPLASWAAVPDHGGETAMGILSKNKRLPGKAKRRMEEAFAAHEARELGAAARRVEGGPAPRPARI